MYTNRDNQLVLRFLNNNYPISRVKYMLRFKRDIIIDGIVYIFSDEVSYKEMKDKLLNRIKLVFGFDHLMLEGVLNEFLPARTKP